MVINSNNTEINDNNKKLICVDEFEVADILLDLPYLVTNSLTDYRFSYHWASKRRRSALVSPPPYSPPRCRRKITAPTPSKVEASSPNTPLSFSNSESDCKSNKLSIKKKKAPGLNLRKKELEESVRERMLTQQQLRDSIDKVKEYYNSLMAENFELKNRKQERVKTACTITTTMEQQQQTSTSAVNDQIHAVSSTSTVYHHQTPLISLHHQQTGGGNGQMRAGPPTPTEYHHQAPLISHHHQFNGGGNDWVHASPSTSTQFQQHYHQPTPLIDRHQKGAPLISFHHGQPSMVNDSVCAVASIPAMVAHPPPLIPHQPVGFVFNPDNQRFVFDLNMQPYEMDSAQADRRAAAAARRRRLIVQKEKRPRVGN